MNAPEPAQPHLPAWLRRTHGEHRWPAALAVVVAIGLQLLLPERMVRQAHYLLPLEGALLLALVLANPFRMNRESALLRTAGLALTALVGLSNGWSAVLLVLHLVEGGPNSPAELLTTGAAIWLTNVLAFALAYWERSAQPTCCRCPAGRS